MQNIPTSRDAAEVYAEKRTIAAVALQRYVRRSLQSRPQHGCLTAAEDFDRKCADAVFAMSVPIRQGAFMTWRASSNRPVWSELSWPERLAIVREYCLQNGYAPPDEYLTEDAIQNMAALNIKPPQQAAVCDETPPDHETPPDQKSDVSTEAPHSDESDGSTTRQLLSALDRGDAPCAVLAWKHSLMKKLSEEREGREDAICSCKCYKFSAVPGRYVSSRYGGSNTHGGYRECSNCGFGENKHPGIMAPLWMECKCALHHDDNCKCNWCLQQAQMGLCFPCKRRAELANLANSESRM